MNGLNTFSPGRLKSWSFPVAIVSSVSSNQLIACVRADWAGLEHREPVLLARESPKHEGIFLGVEVCVEVVPWRRGGKAGRHGQPPLGIERDNHGGIIPPTPRAVNVSALGARQGCGPRDVDNAGEAAARMRSLSSDGEVWT